MNGFLLCRFVCTICTVSWSLAHVQNGKLVHSHKHTHIRQKHTISIPLVSCSTWPAICIRDGVNPERVPHNHRENLLISIYSIAIRGRRRNRGSRDREGTDCWTSHIYIAMIIVNVCVTESRNICSGCATRPAVLCIRVNYFFLPLCIGTQKPRREQSSGDGGVRAARGFILCSACLGVTRCAPQPRHWRCM